MAFVTSFTGVSLTPRARTMVSSKHVAVRAARSTRMSLAPVAQDVALNMNDAAMTIATKVGDFGGYTGPVLGLLTIFVIIAVLTPAVKE